MQLKNEELHLNIIIFNQLNVIQVMYLILLKTNAFNYGMKQKLIIITVFTNTKTTAKRKMRTSISMQN